MKKSYGNQAIGLRAISLTILIAFCFNTIAWAAPVGGIGILGGFNSEVPIQNLIEKIVIPQELGTI